MSVDSTERTRIDAETEISHIRVSDATREVYVMQAEGRAPRILLTGDGERARIFDLSAVTTEAHGWLADDGLDESDPDIVVRSGKHCDDVLIRGVAEHMVSIDYAPYRDDTPRLLLWTEHTNDDDEPRAFSL